MYPNLKLAIDLFSRNYLLSNCGFVVAFGPIKFEDSL
jgi:hypothetical protein